MKVIYENEHYLVKVSEGNAGYDLINRRTEVVEGFVAHLPGAMMTADTYNDHLIKQERGLNETNLVSIRKNDPK